METVKNRRSESLKTLVKETISGSSEATYRLLLHAPEDIDGLFEEVKRLSDDELFALGRAFRKFPFGCDLLELLVDPMSLRQSWDEIRGSFRVVDRLGFPTHVCSYVLGDWAEILGKTPLELLKELRELSDMPFDVDHFGRYGPMRYPKEISGCSGECYNSGKGFTACPYARIHKRLIDKEKQFAHERDDWFRLGLAQSVGISLYGMQRKNAHAAEVDEMLEVANVARKYGAGVGSIIAVADGEEELLRGIKAVYEQKIDESVLEGGPYNRHPNRPRAFAEGVVMLRILTPGKVVATNGQYEDELRWGLRAGLNSVITGFPGNHHAYMSGYRPGEANVNKFGLPKVWEILNQEVTDSYFEVPAGRRVAEIIAKSAMFLENFLYPFAEIGGIPIGDAHWVVLKASPLGRKNRPKITISELVQIVKEKKVKRLGLIGGRFVAWGIAKALEGVVEEVVISDKDPYIERVSKMILGQNLNIKISTAGGDDERVAKECDLTVLASFIPSLIKKFSCSDKVLVLD